MSQIADRYRRLSTRFTDVVQSVPDDRWTSPSPCSEWTAQGVFEHVVSTESDMLGRMPFAGDLGIEGMPAKQAWPIVRDAVQDALDDPARADHSFDGYFGPTTFAATVDRFYGMDLAVHAWDIAHAAGLTELESIPTDEIGPLAEALAQFGDSARQPGVFGPALPVPPGADPQTKLLADLGRAS